MGKQSKKKKKGNWTKTFPQGFWSASRTTEYGTLHGKRYMHKRCEDPWKKMSSTSQEKWKSIWGIRSDLFPWISGSLLGKMEKAVVKYSEHSGCTEKTSVWYTIAGWGEKKNITKWKAPWFYSIPPTLPVFWMREKKSLFEKRDSFPRMSGQTYI